MAHLPNTQLPNVRPSDDGKWLRCPQCDDAYWGAFRPTDFILAKLTAHVERKHKAAEAGVEAPAAAQLPRPKAPKAQGARAAAKAAKKGDGPVRVVREGPKTADLLGDAMADILNDMGFEIDPRLQLAQGPRVELEDRNVDRERQAKDINRGQDVIARVQAQLSPIKGWA